MSFYSAARFYANVKDIVHAKGLQLGDVENRAKMSKGYLSRLPDLKISSICNLAEVLEVSVPELLEDCCFRIVDSENDEPEEDGGVLPLVLEELKAIRRLLEAQS